MQSIKVHSVTGDVRPVNAISVWDASSTGKRPVDSIPVWDDTNDGDKPLNAIQVKLVGDEPSAIKVWFKDSEGPGPSDLVGPKTIRFEFLDEGVNPLEDSTAPDTFTWTHVKDNIYDLHIDYDDWGQKLDPSSGSNRTTLQLVKTLNSKFYFLDKNLNVLDMNCEGVTNLTGFFSSCVNLHTVDSIRNTSNVTNFTNMFTRSGGIKVQSVPLFDTSNATDISNMFDGCKFLTSLPDFNFVNVTNCNRSFYGCVIAEGALKLYNKLSSNGKVTHHSNTFKNCGSNTPTGIADLAFIPTDWGGNFTGFNEVTIGDVTWSDSNVAIDDGEGGIVLQVLHDVNGVDLGTQYYYTYEAANRIANKLVGWKLPSNSEIASLYLVDRQALMSNSAWTYHNGNNGTGLNMKPVGYCNPTLENTGTYSPFWQDNGVAYSFVDSTWATELVSIPSFSYIPIRLVKV